MTKTELENRIGCPVDLAPWGYRWDSAKAVQDTPEAYFIPRRIKRVDEVYRTAYDVLGAENVKSICYFDQPDIAAPLLPKPEGKLLTGLLWVGGLTDYECTLTWQNGKMPSADQIEVRSYPTAWGWFGLTRDRVLVLADATENTMTFRPEAGERMDTAYNQHGPAATQLVCVFARGDCDVPGLSLTGPELGVWEKLDFTVTWGLDGKTAEPRFFAQTALFAEPEVSGNAAKVTCLYTKTARYGADSRFTVLLDEVTQKGATVNLALLAEKPIYVPEVGLYFCPSTCAMTAEQYKASCADKKTIQQETKLHKEPESFEEALKEFRLRHCPEGTEIPEFPWTPAAPAAFHVPDKRWQKLYETAVNQLRGRCMWGRLSGEVARACLAMEMTGLYNEADAIYDYFLSSPGIKADGDYTTGFGAMEWATGMRHDMGYAHEGTHFSNGRLLFSMMYRFLLTGDESWLRKRLNRLKLAAMWNIRETENYMKGIPNREKLHVYGLMPPCMLGDYALPACDWHWYYLENAFTYQALSAFARALRKIEDPEAALFTEKAAVYGENLRAAVKREALLAPVREGSDGMFRSFIPRAAYTGGLLHYGKESKLVQFDWGKNDMYQGALPLGDIMGPFPATDRRIMGTLNAMEERGRIYAKDNDPAYEKAEGYAYTFAHLPKISHNANLYLRQDDIESFLRFFMGHTMVMIGSDGKLWEHAHCDSYAPCNDPDNGTAGWFVECFRDMLVTEDEEVLWLAKGTPRYWLKQGSHLGVSHTMTLYGELAYEIVSDADNGVLRAEIHVPSRCAVPVLKLRLRHPEGKKISRVSAAVPCCVSADGETVEFEQPAGIIRIKVFYE